MRVAKTGGTAVPIAQSMHVPHGIAAINGCVYWTNQGDGTVWQAPD
jgi:hypothetical protein